MSSTNREAMPSRRESPSSRVSPALVEVLVTQDINRCNLLSCSRPIDAIWAAQGGRAVANRSNLGGAGRGEQPAREAAQGKRCRGLG